jgi:hypothetical protein
MIWFSKPDCPVLIDKAYVSPALIFVNLMSYASHNTCSHTLLLHLSNAYIGELSWISLQNMQNGISRPNLNCIQYAHILGS